MIRCKHRPLHCIKIVPDYALLYYRVCVEADLCSNQAFLIDCYACRQTSDEVNDFRTMHVQGLSHWAPANIGPYSQCKQVRDGTSLFSFHSLLLNHWDSGEDLWPKGIKRARESLLVLVQYVWSITSATPYRTSLLRRRQMSELLSDDLAYQVRIATY